VTDADALRLADYILLGQGATVTRLCAAGVTEARRLRDATMPGRVSGFCLKAQRPSRLRNGSGDERGQVTKRASMPDLRANVQDASKTTA